MAAVKTQPSEKVPSAVPQGWSPGSVRPPAKTAVKLPFSVRLFPWVTGLALVSLLGNTLMYFRFTTLRPLVTVGSHVISKREYLAVLDDAAGKQVLNKLVFAELIRQAADKAGVTPTAKDIDQRLAELQARNPKLLASVPEYKLRDAAASDLALENLRIQNVKVTDAEVARYYTAHQSLFQQQEQLQAALIVTGSATDARTATHLFQQDIDPTIISKEPGFHLVGANGFTIDLQRPSRRSIIKTIFSMKAGTVQTFPFDNQFLTVRIYASQGAHIMPLSQVKDQVTRLAKLEKSPSVKAEVAALYKANPPTFDIGKYSAFFEDISRGSDIKPAAGH